MYNFWIEKMKDLKVLINIAVVFILFGCVDNNRPNRKFSNIHQEEFDKMLVQNNNKHYNLGNKISILC